MQIKIKLVEFFLSIIRSVLLACYEKEVSWNQILVTWNLWFCSTCIRMVLSTIIWYIATRGGSCQRVTTLRGESCIQSWHQGPLFCRHGIHFFQFFFNKTAWKTLVLPHASDLESTYENGAFPSPKVLKCGGAFARRKLLAPCTLYLVTRKFGASV